MSYPSINENDNKETYNIDIKNQHTGTPGIAIAAVSQMLQGVDANFSSNPMNRHHLYLRPPDASPTQTTPNSKLSHCSRHWLLHLKHPPAYVRTFPQQFLICQSLLWASAKAVCYRRDSVPSVFYRGFPPTDPPMNKTTLNY